MTTATLVESLAALLLVAYICVKQLTWSAVDTRRMWRAPMILGIVGLVLLGTSTQVGSLSAPDLGFAALELVVALGAGALMGLAARFRPLSDAARLKAEAADARRDRARARARTEPLTTESRTGWIGIALWVVLIAVRVGFEIAGRRMGLELASSTGLIFLVVAANRAARTLVFASRLDRHLALVR